jgi:hypothetical protein
VQLRAEDRIAEGSFADVFAIPDQGTVAKVFRSASDPGLIREALDVFGAECAAYEILGEHTDLAVHAPEYHGQVAVESVEDDTGFDWSPRYMLNCCYVMERLEGPDVGVFEVTQEWPHVLALMAAFQAVGIAYVTEASVFGWEEPRRTKLIDFAVRGYMP